MNDLDVVANILSKAEELDIDVNDGTEGVNDVEAYTISLQHPVCPCCGKHLHVIDSCDDMPEDDLNTDMLDDGEEQIDESTNRGQVLADYVDNAAQYILQGYLDTVSEFDKDDLIYIRDNDLIAAINRKATEIQSLLKSCYQLTIAKDYIEHSIRRQLKYLAYNT